MKLSRFLLLAIAVVLSSCAHEQYSYVSRRAEKTYSFYIGMSVLEAEDALFHAAYEICYKNHKSGFKLTHINTNWNGATEALVECDGDHIDPFLAIKYKGTALRITRNEAGRPEGFNYQYEIAETTAPAVNAAPAALKIVPAVAAPSK